MSPISHQTIHLSRGRHSSPEHGACVMELASMLAGEPFSDHPTSVCPVIGSVLRAYNDSIDDDRRQDLYACASAVVGTAVEDAQQARAARVWEWTAERNGRRFPRALLPGRLRRFRIASRPSIEGIGTLAVRMLGARTEETHAAMLELIDELIAIGPPTRERKDRSESAAPLPAAEETTTAPVAY